MTGDGLFDVPADAYLLAPPAEKLTRGERRRRLVALRIATGVHPLGYVPLHPDAPRRRGDEGPTCGDCRYRVTVGGRNRNYPKCELPVTIGDRTVYPRATGCESSDIRRWWPACTDFQPRDGDGC